MSTETTMEMPQVVYQERIYTAIQYIYLPQLKEYILVFINDEETEPILHNFENRDKDRDQGLVYYFGSISGKLEEMPEMVKEMIDDMDRDNCKVRRYVLAEFKNNCEIDDYISKMQNIQKSREQILIDETYNIIKEEQKKQLKIIEEAEKNQTDESNH